MKTIRLVAALAIATLLSACVSMGETKLIQGTMPLGEKITIGSPDTNFPNWGLSIDGLKLSFVVMGDVTPIQLAAIKKAEELCREHVHIVRPHPLVEVVADALLIAPISSISLATGVTWAFKAARFGDYAKEGFAIGAGSGAATGVLSSGGKVYTFDNCGQGIFAIDQKYGVRILSK